MRTQKYLYESFLFLGSGSFSLLRLSDNFDYCKELIHEHKNYIYNSNIYFLCKKPRLRFIESSMAYDQSKLKIGFELWTKKGIKQVWGTLKDYKSFFPNATDFSIHNTRSSKFVVKLSNGSTYTYPIEHIFNLFSSLNDFDSFLDSETTDYEILYIGKGIGNKKPSNAYKRVQDKHEKIQEILIDILENEPYNELFTLLMDVDKPDLLCSSFPHLCDSRTINNEGRLKELSISTEEKFSKNEIIDITEACLIKYFDPIYNKNLKDKDSSGKEKVFQKCKKLDINSIVTVIDNSQLVNVLLYSQSVEVNNLHKSVYKLHAENNRVNYSDFNP